VAVGSATLDFGAGASRASVAVTGQTAILSGSHAEAFFMGDSTADHNADEHALAPELMTLSCGSVTAGVGFTISAQVRRGTLRGQFTVRWVWA